MPGSSSKKWRSTKLAPLDIALDRFNPRINIADSDLESDIVRKLIVHEEVADLARRIIRSGLLPGERVIVVNEHSQWVVLEGNRRICACKLLLSPQLIPDEFKKTFPRLGTSSELERIQKIDVDVAPDRRAAEGILTLRHTESGIRKWKPVARMRRVKRLLDEQFTVDEIAAEFDATPAAIRKTIREYRLLQLALGLKGLPQAEREKLEDPDLKTNPFTRFFELAGVREYLSLSFDDNGVLVIASPRRTFDDKLKKVVRAFVKGGEFDTRTDPAHVFGAEFRTFKDALKTQSKTKATSTKSNAPHPSTQAPAAAPVRQQADAVRIDRFFESLVCQVPDQSLAAVIKEIKKINPDLFPISGTYLLRTLVELCLGRLIANSGRRVAGKSDPSLTELVNFSLQNRDVFPITRMADVIDAARSQKCFDYLNIVAHQKWMNADPLTLKSVSNQLRVFIQYVVQGVP